MKPGLGELIGLRREWRNFHQNQDLKNADRVFAEAGLSENLKTDLSPLPELLREKLGEFGREWEGILAVNAAAEGYHFYRADLSLETTSVLPFSHWTEERLEDMRPVMGAPLFFESQSAHPLHGGVWNAFFYFTLRSEVAPESLKLQDAPGVKNSPKFLRIA